MNELSARDRMILDLDKTAYSAVARDSLCRRIELPTEKYAVVSVIGARNEWLQKASWQHYSQLREKKNPLPPDRQAWWEGMR